MNVYRIHTTRKNMKGAPIYIDFACHIETLEEFTNLLNKGQFIVGDQLFVRATDDDEGPCKAIKSSRRIVIGSAGVTMIEVPADRFVKFTEDAP